MTNSLYDPEYECMIALLREIRAARGVTQVQLAKTMRISQGEISRCERGQRRLDPVELRRWCGGLGISFVGFAQKLDRALKK